MVTIICNAIVAFQKNNKKKQHVRSRKFQAKFIYCQLLPLTQRMAVALENIQILKSSQISEYILLCISILAL